LHIAVIDGLPEPCRVTVPVTVWPAHTTFVLWWLVAFVSIVGVRWQQTAAARDTVADILLAMWADLPHLLGLFALGFLIVIPLWLIGWVVSLAEPTGGAE
jgi:hypothetical protein